MPGRAIGYLVAGAVSALAASGAAAQSSPTARAEMSDLEGQAVGSVTFTQMPQGVVLRIELQGLSSGWHAIHIHETASCEPPFASAGAHFNPGDEQHGYDSDGTHAGDLPNIYVVEDGSVRVEFISNRISLASDEPTDVNVLNRALGAVESAAGLRAYNILEGDGAAVVVHSGPDDYRTNPAGDSGDRIACGVVQRD